MSTRGLCRGGAHPLILKIFLEQKTCLRCHTVVFSIDEQSRTAQISQHLKLSKYMMSSSYRQVKTVKLETGGIYNFDYYFLLLSCFSMLLSACNWSVQIKIKANEA
eukprot:5734317-Amphidinium_carterae.2